MMRFTSLRWGWDKNLIENHLSDDERQELTRIVSSGNHLARQIRRAQILLRSSDDMLKVGGAWVSPTEVESTLSEHPAVMGSAVLGAIDHDPASSEAANSIVRANRFFTKDANGVSKPWSARTIFTNPLYGKVGNK